jgi:hypothetical protein
VSLLGYEVDRLKRIVGRHETEIIALGGGLTEIGVAALPAAAVGNYGTFRLIFDAGTSGYLVICLKTSGGAYEWVTVATSSS